MPTSRILELHMFRRRLNHPLNLRSDVEPKRQALRVEIFGTNSSFAVTGQVLKVCRVSKVGRKYIVYIVLC